MTSSQRHATVARQLRRLGLSAEALPPDTASWNAFLDAVSKAYTECEQNLYLVTRAERLATEELERSQAALAEAERLAGLGSWTWYTHVSTISISPVLARLLGRSEECRQLSMDEFVANFDVDDRDLLQDCLLHARSQTVALSGELRVRIHHDGADQEPRWVQYRIGSRQNAKGTIDTVTGTLLDITERMQAEERVRTLAFHDPLTGLINRARFVELLGSARARARSKGQQIAILFLDLDGFKAVNDQFGHDVGDSLLREVALRLKATVRSTDQIARFGGDEFLVMIDAFERVEDVSTVARKLLSTISRPFEIEGREVAVGVSIGIATYQGEGHTTQDLIKAADSAMYVAKQRGKGTFVFHPLGTMTNLGHGTADLADTAQRQSDGDSCTVALIPLPQATPGATGTTLSQPIINP